MDLMEAIRTRHSVRQYTGQPLSEEHRQALKAILEECERESGIRLQLVLDDPECVTGFFAAHYGHFRNAYNYIALIGPKDRPDLEETAGYYGEKAVIEAQRIGLRTCWIAGTYSKKKCKAEIGDDEKLACVISVGYGENDGRPHRNKPVGKICSVPEADMPAWFRTGLEAAMAAPTAINQQKFTISLDGENAVIRADKGPYSMIDLGIVRYHFEAASGHRTI